MQHNVRRYDQVGLLTAGGRQGDTWAELHRASGQHQIMCCESGSCGQQTMQAIQGMATHTNETNKHCVARATQPAGIKAEHGSF